MIVDSHQHLGGCFVFDHHVSAEELIGYMDGAGVDASMVMPFPGTDEEAGVHDQIAALAQKHPGRIFGMISINPHCGRDAYMREAERCVKMGFRAVKIHPLGHACPVTAKDADKVFEAAEIFNLPVLVHTGLGVPMTLPSVIVPRARRHPELKIVLSHAGAYVYSGEAELVAKECPNVYLETSWVGAPHRVRSFIKSIGAGRVMFGSDLPDNMENELTKYRSIKTLSKEEMDMCLGETARELFRL
ncbi:MAG: amidohydrolase family protein [Acidaminococcales bacterium]|jgi:predicted TIM-barrel fold metal-dependent hydrolase|nr:amidohydrolase family protein [Acidaminococcales bacterium]